LTGDNFTLGSFNIVFIDNSVADDSGGARLLGKSQSVDLRELQSSLAWPLDRSNIGLTKINRAGYIEVQFPDPFGVGLTNHH
jgi:hypothetical protein